MHIENKRKLSKIFIKQKILKKKKKKIIKKN